MSVFKFKHFKITQHKSAMKVGTDAMILGAFVDSSSRKRALDIGTGTGVLSLMLAQQNKELLIQAVEIESDAFEEASSNVKESRFSAQIEVLYGDFKKMNFENQFDLIVSNPPFFDRSLLSVNESKNLARHTYELNPENLIKKVEGLLTDDGSFYMIFPHGNLNRIEKIAQQNDLFLNELVHIESKAGIPSRNIFVIGKQDRPLITKHLIVRNQHGNYTDDYKKLTVDFHSKPLP